MGAAILKLLLITQITLAFGKGDENILPPSINKVSVRPDSESVEVEWVKSESQGISYYELYRYYQEGSFLINLFTPEETSYLHSNIEDVNLGPVSYSMRSAKITDSDTIWSALSDYHSTIWLHSVWDSCEKTIELNWTPYISWGSLEKHYNIYYSKSEDPFSLHTTVQGSVNTFRFSDSDIQTGYNFYIEAVNSTNQKTSKSNLISLFTEMSREPGWIGLDYISVENNRIFGEFSTDPANDLINYTISRAAEPEGEFTVISNHTALNNNMFFSDPGANPENQWYYKVESLNYCGVKVATSNIASNIVLKAVYDKFDVTLEWNDFKGWNSSERNWKIYRSDITGNLSEIITLPNQLFLNYTDNVEPQFRETLNSKFCYMAEVSHLNRLNIEHKSQSNIACVNISTSIFIPNAFIPGSGDENGIFLPIIHFEPKSYLLTIADRLGNRVFETTNPNIGWTGLSGGSGQTVPHGLYIYYLRAITPENITIERRGYVMAVEVN